jgi:hypothetical protein
MYRNTKEMLKKFISNWVILFRRQFLANRKVNYGLQKRKTLKFEVHITDHC